MFMGLVIRMHMGLVRDGEIGVLLSGSRMERFAFGLEVRPGSWDYPFHGIDAFFFFFWRRLYFYIVVLQDTTEEA